jgi:hypothetical protein
MKLSTAYKVLTNQLQNFDSPGMVIFRRKNICGISTENYVLCSFELIKDPIFRIRAIRMDLKKNYGFCPISTFTENYKIHIFVALGGVVEDSSGLRARVPGSIIYVPCTKFKATN